ncbi:tail fiber domain-containing protein [uncultured Mucilaginibacter sp.]|uniref:tail fiber domain-containing protein n=1 Tax=uncultured Mucilaginibacter sp. TaxID=797541 RepID=UPI0025FC99C9|nr:tail fiber domain-containing protein [uncultured Mucilaginibacter sp.]
MKTSNFIAVLSALSLFSTVSFAQSKVSENQLKQNVTPIKGALSAVNQIEPISYNYNNQLNGLKLPGGTQYGFNADNVQSVLPNIVRTHSMLPAAPRKGSVQSVDIKTVDVQSLVPVLLGAIKEQQQQIDALKAEVQALRTKGGSNTSAAIK